MALFRKSKPDENNDFQRDPRKSHSWFEKASAVADTRQYEFAIECFISGLRHDPGNRNAHEQLREVALKRKVGGGKPAGLTERLRSAGNDPINKFLHGEKLWVKDPLNLQLMLQTIKLAVAADKVAPDDKINEIAYWIGTIILEGNQTSKKPDKASYLKLRDLLVQIGAYEKAVMACRLALQLDPQDTTIQNELKDLEAENTMQEGRYADGDVDFRASVRDMDKQRQLGEEDAITKTESVLEHIIQRRRTEYEQEPADTNRLHKLVDALLQKESDQTESEAIQLLQSAHEQTGQYRYRVRVGDIRMRQMARQFRLLKKAADAKDADPQARGKLESLYRQRMQFELDQYTERVKNYPTDLGLKFQLGMRLFAFKKYDEAISAFQQAKVDPKHRALAHEHLGRCYLAREWFDEAVDTLRQGIELHPLTDDRLGKEMRYRLMDALARAAELNNSPEHAREAQKIASQLLQTDINYRDIRQRIDALRQLADRLQKGKSQ